MRETHVILVNKNKVNQTRVFEEHFTSMYKWAIPKYSWMREGLRIKFYEYFKKEHFILNKRRHSVDCKNLVDRILLFMTDAMTDDMIKHNNKLIFYAYNKYWNIVNRCSWSIREHIKKKLEIKPTIVLEDGNITKCVFLEVKSSTKEEILKNYYKGVRYEDIDIS